MWTSWEPWTQCTKTYCIGERIRKRECSNPAPENNGEYCTGPRSEKEYCSEFCTGKWTNLSCHNESNTKFK